MKKRFGLIGVAGFIAPRHLKAIKDTGNQLIVALDLNDSVGIMDSFFPNAEFFKDINEFSAFIEKEKRAGYNLDYMTICSPNHLHLSHIKFSIKHKINVICEKPIVLRCSEIDEIRDYEKKYKVNVNSILQLRLHPEIIQLKNKVLSLKKSKNFEVDLTYITSRGKWYNKSWKGETKKSGGIASNIGVHFFDMLSFIFGPIIDNEVHLRNDRSCSGYLICKRAQIRWFLSIDSKFLPLSSVKNGKSTFRSISIEGEELEFSSGFNNLHTESYKQIIKGNGYGLETNRDAIGVVESIINKRLEKNPKNPHPLLFENKVNE